MKLKVFYLFFIVFLSFCTKAQSKEISEPFLANSGSLLNDTLKNNDRNNLPQLLAQDSKLLKQDTSLIRQPNLNVSEAYKMQINKEVTYPQKK